MTGAFEVALRGPEAYGLARRALELMELQKVWPTPLNYELWLHYAGNPEGPLAAEIDRLVKAGEAITEAISETLAAAYLPKAKLNEQIRDAGDQLSRELNTVAEAIAAAQRTNEAYGVTLAGASRELTGEGPALQTLVQTLTSATQKVQMQNQALEARLQESTSELDRLRDHLEQVRRDATTDALTNLANRKAFDEELDRARNDAARTGAPLTLALLDIDYFKQFNDTWGHQTGDQVLRYVASVIGRVAVAPRIAARYGGEEFGMLFPGETAAEVAEVLEEIRAEISSRTLKRRSTNEELSAVTLSAGVAESGPEETAHALLERADSALYASKRNGRNQVTVSPDAPSSKAA